MPNSYGWRSQTLTIMVASLQPDLVAVDIIRNSFMNYTAVVKNNGDAASGGFKARLTSANSKTFIAGSSIAPGATRNIAFSFPQDSSCGGGATAFKMTLEVDSDNSIAEKSEGNNKITKAFNCY